MIGTKSTRGKTIGIVAGITIVALGALIFVLYPSSFLDITSNLAPTSSDGQRDISQDVPSKSLEDDDTTNDNPATTQPLPVSSSDAKLDELRLYALQKINDDRAKFGLAPVKLSSNQAAQIHAEELIQTKQLSHWTTDGMKPYMRYSLYGGTGYVAQNAANQYTVGDEIYEQSRISMCKAGIAFGCDHFVKEAIDTAHYNMMYDDLECCNNGHRDNILDKFHTHVSIGVAYDGLNFGFIQNFENQYIDWDEAIAYEPSRNIVSMEGDLDHALRLYTINIFYDPLPAPKTYEDNLDEGSYDAGTLIATIVEPAPFGSFYTTEDDYILIEADQWTIDNTNDFEISFVLDKASENYGDGVYTVMIWATNEDEEPFPVANISIFRNDST